MRADLSFGQMPDCTFVPGSPRTSLALGSAHLYDDRRGIHYVKPSWRGWLHLAWFNASLVVGTLLLVATHGSLRVAATAIYVGSVSGLFGVSALYHLGNWRPSTQAVLQRADHLMIFVLIAGTATPMFLIAAPGAYGRIGLTVLWTLTVVAATVHGLWMHAPERLVGAVFISLGATAALALPPVWTATGTAAGTLIICGGVLYIVGTLCYHRRWPDPAPARFGYHEVFHAFVCAAASCHYVAVALLVR